MPKPLPASDAPAPEPPREQEFDDAAPLYDPESSREQEFTDSPPLYDPESQLEQEERYSEPAEPSSSLDSPPSGYSSTGDSILDDLGLDELLSTNERASAGNQKRRPAGPENFGLMVAIGSAVLVAIGAIWLLLLTANEKKPTTAKTGKEPGGAPGGPGTVIPVPPENWDADTGGTLLPPTTPPVATGLPAETGYAPIPLPGMGAGEPENGGVNLGQSPAELGTGAAAAEPEEEEKIRLEQGIAQAREVLRRYFDSESLEDQIKLVLHPEQVRRLSQRVYGDIDRWNVEYDKFEYSSSSQHRDTGLLVHIFLLHLKERGLIIPATVEETAQGYRLNWETLMQLKDFWFERFLRGELGRQMTLRVFLERTHHFGRRPKDLDMEPVKITGSLGSNIRAVGFIDKKSDMLVNIDTNIAWDTRQPAIVKLERRHDASDQLFLEILEIVRFGWEG